MKNLSKKFKISIDIDLLSPEFDVSVVNMSGQKSFIDVAALREKLLEVMEFMQKDGMDSLISQVNQEQLH